MSLTFRPIPAVAGHSISVPLGLNNRGWAPVTLFLVGTVAAALVYACTATYARKERVTGYLTPREGVARVSAPQPGIITEMFVKNGDLVKVGDPLFTLDTSHGLASGSTLGAALSAGLQRQVTLLDEQIIAEQARAQSEADRFSTRVQGLIDALPSLQAQRALQVARASATEARLKALRELRAKGYVSEAEYRAREEAWLSQRQGLAAIDQQITTLKADLAQARIDQARAPLDSADRLSRLAASQVELRQRLSEVDAQGEQLIRAPMSGRVTASQANVGQRLDPAKPALTIVPVGAILKAELLAHSRSIGCVRTGQRVRLMYDAYPYQRFGTFGGIIESISQTTLTSQEMYMPLHSTSPSYTVSVKLDSEDISVHGIKLHLLPGMSITSDLILEDDKIIDLLLRRVIYEKY